MTEDKRVYQDRRSETLKSAMREFHAHFKPETIRDSLDLDGWTVHPGFVGDHEVYTDLGSGDFDTVTFKFKPDGGLDTSWIGHSRLITPDEDFKAALWFTSAAQVLRGEG
ncbi:MAG: hypothetical protein ACSLE1_15805 [Sphingobium sp.]